MSHYKDPLSKGGHGSIVDEEAIAKNNSIEAPLVDFMKFEETALDRANAAKGDAEADAAYANFQQWAQAEALTGEPEQFNGQWPIERMFYSLGLNILALKFKCAGYELTPKIIHWLGRINEKNIKKYQGGSGNQYVWAGASAALFSLISKDSKSIAFQEQVWRASINSINPDGSINSELSRGIASLSYHGRWLTGILLLKDARRAMGHQASADRVAKIKSLTDFIGRALCDPTEIQRKAHVNAMHMPNQNFRNVPAVFATDLLSPDWTNCGPTPKNCIDTTLGGDLKRTREVLERVARPDHK